MFHNILDHTVTYLILNFTFLLLSIAITNGEQCITNSNMYDPWQKYQTGVQYLSNNIKF